MSHAHTSIELLLRYARDASAVAEKKKKQRKERGNKQERQENMRGLIQLHISQQNVSISRGITEVLALFVVCQLSPEAETAYINNHIDFY